MNKGNVTFKKGQSDEVGEISKSISKTQPAQKVAEVDGERILPAAKTGQKKATQFPKRIKTESKKEMKGGVDYTKKDETGKPRKDSITEKAWTPEARQRAIETRKRRAHGRKMESQGLGPAGRPLNVPWETAKKQAVMITNKLGHTHPEAKNARMNFYRQGGKKEHLWDAGMRKPVAACMKAECELEKSCWAEAGIV